jgi:hypothetical protein
MSNDADTDVGMDDGVVVDAGVDTDAEMDVGVESDAEMDAESDVESEVESDVESEVESEVVPDVESEVVPDVESEVVPDVESEVVPDVESDVVLDDSNVDVIGSNDSFKDINDTLLPGFSTMNAQYVNNDNVKIKSYKLSPRDMNNLEILNRSNLYTSKEVKSGPSTSPVLDQGSWFSIHVLSKFFN